MALKDRFRKAIGRDGRSSSTSTASGPGTGTTTPNHPLTTTSTNTTVDPKDPTHTTAHLSKQTTNAPGITLTKTLTKSLTWTSHRSKDSKDHSKPSKQELKEKKAVEAWKKQDAEEWVAPKSSRPGRKNQKCQDTLRAFDFKQFDGKGGVEERSRSICSGISPSQSRANSVDVGDGEGLTWVLSGGRKRSSVGAGKLSQEVGREEVEDVKVDVNGELNGQINGHAKGQKMQSVGEE